MSPTSALHLRNAGFEFEIATPTGAPVVLEMWAFPKDDKHVNDYYKEVKDSFNKPRSLADSVTTSLGGDQLSDVRSATSR